MSERRPRGYLTKDILHVLQQVVSGEVEIDPNSYLTPGNLGKLLVEVDGLEKEDAPSTGAVTAILKRLERIGMAAVEYDPYRFIDFTEEGRSLGYDVLDAKFKLRGGNPSRDKAQREALKAERAAKKKGRVEEAPVELEEVTKDLKEGHKVDKGLLDLF